MGPTTVIDGGSKAFDTSTRFLSSEIL